MEPFSGRETASGILLVVSRPKDDWKEIIVKRFLFFLLILGLIGCGEGQKTNPLPRAAVGKADHVEQLNPLPKEAVK